MAKLILSNGTTVESVTIKGTAADIVAANEQVAEDAPRTLKVDGQVWSPTSTVPSGAQTLEVVDWNDETREAVEAAEREAAKAQSRAEKAEKAAAEKAAAADTK